jgi:Superfamily II DNA helicase
MQVSILRKCRLVIRLDFPRNIIDICQEKGRAGRLPGATAEAFKFLICISLESFIDMYKMILLHDEDHLDPSYQQQEIRDLLQIAYIFSSSYCTTALLEYEMSNLFLHDMPHSFPATCGICNNCRGSHVFPAVNRLGLHRVLFHLFAVGPHNINGKRTVSTVVKALCNYPQVNMLVFCSSSTRVQPQKLKQVLFMVIASGIVDLFIDNHEVCLRLAATQQEGVHDYAIRDDHRWQSFRLI